MAAIDRIHGKSGQVKMDRPGRGRDLGPRRLARQVGSRHGKGYVEVTAFARRQPRLRDGFPDIKGTVGGQYDPGGRAGDFLGRSSGRSRRSSSCTRPASAPRRRSSRGAGCSTARFRARQRLGHDQRGVRGRGPVDASVGGASCCRASSGRSSGATTPRRAIHGYTVTPTDRTQTEWTLHRDGGPRRRVQDGADTAAARLLGEAPRRRVAVCRSKPWRGRTSPHGDARAAAERGALNERCRVVAPRSFACHCRTGTISTCRRNSTPASTSSCSARSSIASRSRRRSRISSGWSLCGLDGQPVAYDFDDPEEVRRSTLKSLKVPRMREITVALDRHEAAEQAALDGKKKDDPV